jgi:GGDEF domain-containing protein
VSEPLPPPQVSPDGKFYWDGQRWVPVAGSPSHDSSPLSDGPYAGLTRQNVFLAERLPAYLAAGRHSLVLLECEHSTWKAAADSFGHAGSDAFVAEVILRLRSGLARADEWSALGFLTFATMLAGDDFADQVRAVRECVMQASRQPIVWKHPQDTGPREIGTPRFMAAVMIVAEPSQVSAAELIYFLLQSARYNLSPNDIFMRDGVRAWIHEQEMLQPFDLWSRRRAQAGGP